MATQYDTYLATLRRAKMNSPEMDMYKRNISSLSEPFNLMNRQISSVTKRGGASTAKQKLSRTRSQTGRRHHVYYRQHQITATQLAFRRR